MSVTPAPGALEAVRRFVNTWDEESQSETLDSPAALARWLRADAGPNSGTARATVADLRRALALREALRAVLLHHGGLALDPGAPAVLTAAAHRVRLTLTFDEQGHQQLTPLASGVDGALGALLATVAAAQSDGTWQRLKVCPADDCQWAFYDRSKNRSAVWCDMKVCGNRAKVRTFRARGAVP
jgi:predicted RNA-binding Zn ribbon-like protein